MHKNYGNNIILANINTFGELLLIGQRIQAQIL